MNKDELIQLIVDNEAKKFNCFRYEDNFSRLDLSGIKLKNVILSNFNFSNINFSDSDFSCSKLVKINFKNSDLTCINLHETLIKQSDFSGSRLIEAKLDNSKILDCNFLESDMCGANLSNSILAKSNLKFADNLADSKYNHNTIWPDYSRLPRFFRSRIKSGMKADYDTLKNWLDNKNFQKDLNQLANKYKGKRVLIYGAGIVFKVIFDNYNLDNLDIIALADQKFYEDYMKFLGFKGIPPANIPAYKPDVILIATYNIRKIEKFLKSNILPLMNNEPVIEPLIHKNYREKIIEKLENYGFWF